MPGFAVKHGTPLESAVSVSKFTSLVLVPLSTLAAL